MNSSKQKMIAPKDFAVICNAGIQVMMGSLWTQKRQTHRISCWGKTAVRTCCMRGLNLVAFLVLSTVAAALQPAKADEIIAKVANATPSFQANGRSLKTGSVIAEHARLSTSASGRGEVVFIDGTKLALGPSSSLTVTKSLMRAPNRFSKLGIAASRGAFRWISGSSGSSSYALSTPISTMGIRGTALDFTVRGSKTYVALLSGRARVCGGGGCQELRRNCDFVEINGKITEAKPVSAGFKSVSDAANVFPFMANPRALSVRLRVGGSNCLSPASFNGKLIAPPPTVAPPPPSPAPPAPSPAQPQNRCGGNCGNGNGNGGGNGTGNEGRGND